MRTNKNTSKIILAIVVALLATMISYSSFNNMQAQLGEKEKILETLQGSDTIKDFSYAVATKDLKAGELVADDDIDFSSFSTPTFGAFENRSDVVNKVLLKDIIKGTVFTDSYIAKISGDEIELKEGFRALTLPAEKFQGKSNRMKTGSNVDILSDFEGGWSMEGVKIIGLEGEKGLPAGDIINAKTITFEVPADDMADLIMSISKGNSILVSRNPGDKKIGLKKKKSPASTYSANDSYSSLPNLPANVPISDYPSSGVSGLPQPIAPLSNAPSVEVIEANVKTKVTFD